MNRFIGFLLFFSFVLSSNPFFYERIPSSYILIFVGLILSTFLLFAKRDASYRNLFPSLCLAGPLLIAYFCSSVSSSSFLSIPLYIAISLAAVSILPFFSIVFCARFLHIYASCLVLGSFCMIVYQLLGGSALFELNESSYRVLRFFPFSFSDSQLLNDFYRPCSMFDEPGTFAGFLFGVLAITRSVGYRSYYSSSHWFFSQELLVFGGISSLSFAFTLSLLLVASISFFRRLAINWDSSFFVKAQHVKFYLALLFLLFIIDFLIRDFRFFIDYFISRSSFFALNEYSLDSGRLSGLNSSFLYLSKYIPVLPNVICVSDEIACGDMNWNPLYYIVRDGYLGSLSSLAFAMILVRSYLRSNNIWHLAFFLFFFQRNNWFYSWFALLTAILVFFIYVPPLRGDCKL